MSELLQSIRNDLLSRNLLPLLAVAGVALVGALSYVAVGGKSSAPPPVSTPAPQRTSEVSVAQAPPNATAAGAETPSGTQYQTQGPTRNPFTPLPGAVSTGASAKAASASSSATASKSSASGTQGSGRSSSGAGGSAPSAPVIAPAPTHAPSPPHGLPKPEALPFYSVSAMFGPAPANPGEPATLTPYDELKRFEPLPSAKVPLIVFVGVSAKQGERAVFALVVPPILRGPASCFPSDTHCEAIELPAGKSEELEYAKSNGETMAFELKVVKILKRGSAGGAHAKALHVSKAGERALRHAGLGSLG